MQHRKEKAFLTFWILYSLPGILSATCSTNGNYSTLSNTVPSSWILNQHEVINCVHGFCNETGICECNPCWSGRTCEEYIDRFSPRFLAEEPFFIYDIESTRRKTPLVSISSDDCTHGREINPLFRIESSDDDLGLTCQLGQVGPAATCPCATPRYSVVGSSKSMFYSDEETGDVFLRDGFTLEPSRNYFIRLQVKALPVNSSFYKPWTSQVIATLYTRPSSKETFIKLEKDLNLFIDSYNSTEKETKKSSHRLHSRHYNSKSISSSSSSSSSIEDSSLEKSSRHSEEESFSFDSSSSSEEQESDEVNSNPHPPRALPSKISLGKLTPDSIISRYKRQIEDKNINQQAKKPLLPLQTPWKFQQQDQLQNENVPHVKMSLRINQEKENRVINLGEKVKIDIIIQLPLIINHSNGSPNDSFLNFDVQVFAFPTQVKCNHEKAKNNEGLVFGAVIYNGSVVEIAGDISYDLNPTIFKPVVYNKSNGNLPMVPNSIIWEWRNVTSNKHQTCASGNPNKKCSYNEIRLEMYLFTFAIPHLSNSKISFSENDKNSILLKSQITFPSSSSTNHITNEFTEELTYNIKNEITQSQKNLQQQEVNAFLKLPVNIINIQNIVNKRYSKNNIRLKLDGFSEIQQGESKPFKIKVYLTQQVTTITNLKITLVEIHTNSTTQQKSLLTMKELRLVNAGDDILACCPLNFLQQAFQVECSKTHNNNNKTSHNNKSINISNHNKPSSFSSFSSSSSTTTTFCTISAGIVNLCSDLTSEEERRRRKKKTQTKKKKKNNSTWNNIMMRTTIAKVTTDGNGLTKMEKVVSDPDDDDDSDDYNERKMLEFEAIIHSLVPQTTSTTSDSQFVVEAHLDGIEGGHQRPPQHKQGNDTSSLSLLLSSSSSSLSLPEKSRSVFLKQDDELLQQFLRNESINGTTSDTYFIAKVIATDGTSVKKRRRRRVGES